MTFTYLGVEYPVVIVKKRNKNTYVRIKDGCVYVTTSYFVSRYSIQKLLRDNYDSIGKMIVRYESKSRKQEGFYLWGRCYEVVDGSHFKIDEDNGLIYANGDKMLDKEMRSIAMEVFMKRLMYYYNLFEENIPYPALRIRKMKSRWGVCNTRTNYITLNLELIHYDVDCLDYVIVHELSHLLEGNHSKRFWKIVEKYYPNYKAIRKRLRDTC